MTFLNINTAAFTYQRFKEEIFFFLSSKYFILEFIDLKKKLIDCYVNISIVFFMSDEWFS